MDGFRRSALAIAAATLAILAACDDHAGHSHPGDAPKHEHVAPHGGALVVLAEEFAHVEFLLDPADGRLTAYILDGHAQQAVRVAQSELRVTVLAVDGGTPVEVALQPVASELTGETAGDTSRFEASDDRLKGRQRFEGRLVSIEVRGKRFESVAFRYPEGNE